MNAFTHDDVKFMARAIEVASRNLGLTGTNPSVGCVIVKDGHVIAEAATAPSGRPHAERQALNMAGDDAQGATAYVTLEPCAHYGKTPPCALALVEAGISRVVVAVDDPDLRVSGKGYDILTKAGIKVQTGLLCQEAKYDLAGYLFRKTKHRPFVILKMAVSDNGMIGQVGEGQIAITGAESRQSVQELRSKSDAILVGIGTALADDPLLTVRTVGEEYRSPIRIILDRRLELSPSSKLVQTAKQVPVIVVCDDTRSEKAAELSLLGVELLQTNDLSALLINFGERGISQLIVEGGASIARQFLHAGLVDRIMLYQSQLNIADCGIESPITQTNIPKNYALMSTSNFGEDVCYVFERPF